MNTTNPDLYSLEAYKYDLPQELIAQQPCEPRDHARLLIVDRANQTLTETRFDQLSSLLSKNDHLVFNDTKVIPARLIGNRPSGSPAEIFLVKQIKTDIWEVLVKPGRKIRLGKVITFAPDFSCEIVRIDPDGTRYARFYYVGNFYERLHQHGTMPLPHYISRSSSDPSDKTDYQTVYAKNEGAVAAPTAGLHFTDQLLQTLQENGVRQTALTLHVGLGTFKPVATNDIRDHQMHSEPFIVSREAAENLSNRKNQRIIAVGTTSCRALEASLMQNQEIRAGEFDTNIFIYPGYQFQVVDALLTNFHLPGSSLMMLISAFAGYELTMKAYKYAVEQKFRFYSYGDAMFIT